MSSGPLVLYDFPVSGNGWKVRTLLRYLERPFVIRWVDLLKGEQHLPEFRAKNPVGQIPVLEDTTGCCYAESHAILETFAAGSELLPEASRHETRAWLCFEQTWVDGVISRARFRRKFPHVVPTPPAFFDAWRAEGERALLTLEGHLAGRDFMVADRFTIADIGLFAYVHCADEAGFQLASYPAIARWLDRVRSQRGVLPLDDNPEARGEVPLARAHQTDS